MYQKSKSPKTLETIETSEWHSDRLETGSEIFNPTTRARPWSGKPEKSYQ